MAAPNPSGSPPPGAAPSSPPRKMSITNAMGFLPRKASIVERTSAAIEKLGSSSTLKKAGGSSTSLVGNSPEDVQYSMRPEDYDLGSPIGYGSSAVCYIAKYKPLQKNVAIKMIDLDMFERNQIDELRREIQIMSLSKHNNLLPVHGSFVNGSKLYIVTPFLAAGSCLDIMKTAYPDGLEEVSIATIMKQALQGLEYLHKNGLIHRDVKAGNLLVDDDGLVQLADFGVSSSLMETGERKGHRKTFVGTPCWMAPEVMEQSGYDYKADIWSFGITALELATGHAPFAKYPPMKVLLLTLQNDPPTLDRSQTKHVYSKSFKDMIDTCLQKDPAKRPTAEKLLSHPFFKQGKKPSYLVQAILHNLAPIQQRAHNRSRNVPQNEKNELNGDSWDFSTGSEFLGEREDKNASTQDSGRGVRFAAAPTILDAFPSDHNNPQATHSSGTLGAVNAAANPTKKSRFILDAVSSNSLADVAQSSGNSQNASPAQAQPPVPLPTATSVVVQSQEASLPPIPPATVNVSAASGEIKKGRFTVNETSSTTSGSASPSVSAASPAAPVSNAPAATSSTASLSQVAVDKKSRFKVSSVDSTNASVDLVTPGSSGSPVASPSSSLGRNSRFTTSVSSSSLAQEPVAAGSTSQHMGNFQDRLEAFLKQQDGQKRMLQDLVNAFNRMTGSNLGTNNVDSESTQDDAISPQGSHGSSASQSSGRLSFSQPSSVLPSPHPSQPGPSSTTSTAPSIPIPPQNDMAISETLDIVKNLQKSMSLYTGQLESLKKENEVLKFENETLRNQADGFRNELDHLKREFYELAVVRRA